MIRITAGITRKITKSLVSDKSTGPVGLGISFGTWEYEMLGIRNSTNSNVIVEEMYFKKLFIMIT
ncbi:hypothetical protein [Algoriphagus winogradskyi]|uniref:Uncharacterized protein n=1 Tax=Algoriphagus winogradskyi TaxID=237017 RepID=A0ABY1N636_9BACT|nr:hypothetical protein [Algoriphagus winogradskyi]SMP01308.1 hypothetical protein SAMN06265367_1014 [Algoriphagus winogradskyi]